jgi:glycosyltransferase involved in cell wall biosynthesis
VPTFNNVARERYYYNIQSIIMQNYTNYHVVVINDASTDNTGEFIAKILREQDKIPKEKYTVINN